MRESASPRERARVLVAVRALAPLATRLFGGLQRLYLSKARLRRGLRTRELQARRLVRRARLHGNGVPQPRALGEPAGGAAAYERDAPVAHHHGVALDLGRDLKRTQGGGGHPPQQREVLRGRHDNHEVSLFAPKCWHGSRLETPGKGETTSGENKNT